jgi:hypothetical protein
VQVLVSIPRFSAHTITIAAGGAPEAPALYLAAAVIAALAVAVLAKRRWA